MSDRIDRKLNTEDKSPRPDNETLASSHLSDDLLNSYLDGASTVEESVVVQRHLETCDTCQSRLRELRATTLLLSGLPMPLPRRSFQVSPELSVKPGSIWSRFGSWLMPALPAMRTATIAVALLFFAVSIRNAVTDTSESGPVSDFAGIAQATEQPTKTAIQTDVRNTAEMKTNQDQPEAITTEPQAAAPMVIESDNAAAENEIAGEESSASNNEETGLAESAPAAEPELAAESSDSSLPEGANESDASADDSFADADTSDTAERSSAAAGSAGGDGESASDSANSSLAMIAEASPTSTISPTSTATTSPTKTASPVPTSTAAAEAPSIPTSTPAQAVETAGREESGTSGWTLLQIALGSLLVLLLGSLVMLKRYGRTRSQDWS